MLLHKIYKISKIVTYGATQMYPDAYYKYYGIGMLTDPLWEYINKRNDQIEGLNDKDRINQRTTEENPSCTVK